MQIHLDILCHKQLLIFRGREGGKVSIIIIITEWFAPFDQQINYVTAHPLKSSRSFIELKWWRARNIVISVSQYGFRLLNAKHKSNHEYYKSLYRIIFPCPSFNPRCSGVFHFHSENFRVLFIRMLNGRNAKMDLFSATDINLLMAICYQVLVHLLTVLVWITCVPWVQCENVCKFFTWFVLHSQKHTRQWSGPS